jgi:hypothetical protein
LEILEIKGLPEQKAALKRERDVITNQQSTTVSYSQTVNIDFANLGVLSDFLNAFGVCQLGFSDNLRVLNEQGKRLNEKIKKTEEALKKPADKRGTRGVVVVLAEEDSPVELNLTYNVRGASWKPVYDLRAEISRAENQL